MSKTLHILFVEDSEDDVKLLIRELRHGGWKIVHDRVDTSAAMQSAFGAQPWDLIISDYSMPNFSGPAALALARAQAADVPFILISGRVGEEMAVQAMKAGADDYLFKGDLKRLVPAVERELRDAEGRRKSRAIERQLQKQDAQLIEAQQLAHLGTWHTDLRTGSAVLSDEACRILGIDPGGPAVNFERFLGCLDPEDQMRVQKSLHASESTSIQEDCHTRCSDVGARFVHIRGKIFRNENGKPVEATGMIQDTTERRLAEFQLQTAKEDAERANRAKSGFLANMSHEIRTPMTAILGFSEMLLQPGQDHAQRDECIRAVSRNASHLLELINDILDLSKIEAGAMTVERIRFDFTFLLADVISQIRPRAVEKGLGFEVVFIGPIPRTIQSDPTRLRQILLNLLGNALKFTAAGKVLLQIRFEQVETSAKLTLQVTDTGIGLTPEQMGRLFQPFTQAEDSTTRKFGGTGLGLAISQEFARLLGGRIDVESEQAAGSSFTLQLAFAAIDGVEMLNNMSEDKLPRHAALGKWQEIPLHGRILLVEDGRDNQRLLSTHLLASGAEVVIADNGQKAVDLLAREPFDLVLMDMQMPVMDGYTAVAHLRRAGFSAPIIALTAYAMAEDKQKCMAIGCTDYLSKPIDREVFLKTVSHHLPGSNHAAVPVAHASTLASAATGSGIKIKSRLLDYPGMRVIIDEFVAGLPDAVRTFNDLLHRHDMPALRRAVHQLRGASGGYGFDEITAPAATAEESILASADPAVIQGNIESLMSVVREIEGFDDGQNQAPRLAHRLSA